MKKQRVKKRINMLSKAYKIKGQGVASAYEEQVSLVMERMGDDFEIEEGEFLSADITHFHTINPMFFLYTFLKGRTGVRVGYVHMLPETVETSLNIPKVIKNIFYTYMILFYKRMDHLVTVNAFFVEKLMEYGVKKDKIEFIPNYVSQKIFHRYPDSQKSVLRKRWHIDEQAFVVLCAGQLQVRKGVFDFVEVAKRLPDITFVWAGGFSFGKMSDGYAEIKKIVANPPPNIRFLGILEREEMPNVYNLADVMFLPSFEELFPMTVLETMACEIPLLLRDLDIYENILSGFYEKEVTVEGFSNIICRLQKDKTYYEQTKAAAIKGNQFYSPEHVFSMWDDFYRKILSK